MDTAWPQLILTFTDPAHAETAAESLTTSLADTPGWAFLRKHPTWRVRLPPGTDPGVLTSPLNELIATGVLSGWASRVYEPEQRAFGGPKGLAAAHDLAHADSRHILTHIALHTGGLGRRELAILTTTALLHGAGLDYYEQGDVWDRFAAHRRPPHTPYSPALTEATTQLVTADPQHILQPTGDWPRHQPWLDAFTTTGSRLAALADHGLLERGLRAVLAHHLLFTFNRLGLDRTDQAHLAELAAINVFGPRPARFEQADPPKHLGSKR